MKKFFNLLTNLTIIAGILIISYPVISQIYYNYQTKQEVKDFDSSAQKLTSEDVAERIKLATAYNRSLQNLAITDPYTKEENAKGQAEYARMLTVHEKIGRISIPKIDVDLPIYAGSSEEVLQKGVGHLEGTSLPIGGQNTHTVLTVHTGLPNNRLFTDLDKMKVGDKFFIQNIAETLAYEVDSITVIEPTQFDSLNIVPDKDYVTLLTCTPYMINSHRLLVRGHRIPYKPSEEKVKNPISHISIPPLYLVVFAILFLIFIILAWNKWKSKKA